MASSRVLKALVLFPLVVGWGLCSKLSAQTISSAAQTKPTSTPIAPAPRDLPRVVLTLLNAPTDDSIARSIATTITNSTELILRMTGKFDVERADYLLPTRAFPTALLYYRDVGAQLAVYGSVVSEKSGGYRISIRVWNAKRADRPPKGIERSITNLLATFDIADRLSLDVASQVAGKKLEFGRLMVENIAGLGDYGVYADGQLLGRNTNSFRVLSGKRTIIVATKGALGDQPIDSFHVEILPGKTTTVQLLRSTAVAKPSTPESGTKVSSAGAETKKPSGSLFVTTVPDGAKVYLDNRAIGTTPLHRYGVPAGLYQLSFRRVYFKPSAQAIEIEAGRQTNARVKLDVNTKDPVVKALLLRPILPTSVGLTWTAAQIAYWMTTFSWVNHPASDPNRLYLSEGFLFEPPFNLPSILDFAANISYTRFALRAAGDEKAANLIQLIGLGTVGLGLASNFTQVILSNNGMDSYNGPIGSTFAFVQAAVVIGSVLYDLSAAPAAVKRTNDALIEEIQRTGKLPMPKVYRHHHIIVEVNSDLSLRGGVALSLWKRFLSLEIVAGPGMTSFASPALSGDALLRVAGTPFGDSTGALRPVVNAAAGIHVGSAKLSYCLGAGLGLDLLAGALDFFSRSDILYDTGSKTVSPSISFGVRL